MGMQRNMKPHNANKIRALQLVVQLPGNTAEDMEVLDYMREEVLRFLDEPDEVAGSSSDNVTAFSASTKSR